MKALARYQVILLGEQRHIRCEQLAQCCCPNNACRSRSRTRDLLITSPTPYRYTTESPSMHVIVVQKDEVQRIEHIMADCCVQIQELEHCVSSRDLSSSQLHSM